MAKKTVAEKLEDLLGNLEDLIEKNRKEGVAEARECLAKELASDSRKAEMIESLIEHNGFAEKFDDLASFAAGMRFAARLISDESYEY